MGRRMQLQSFLNALMLSEIPGQPSRGKVYYQPETNINIDYPCIIYGQDQERKKHADNMPFFHVKRWQVEVIDTDADSNIPDKVGELKMSSFQRQFKSSGLYHTIYSLYF